MKYLKRTLLLLLGAAFGWCAPWLLADSGWAYISLGILKSPWMSVMLYYGVPTLSMLALSSWLCRLKEGRWLVLGSAMILTWYFQYTWDQNLRFGLYSRCGNGSVRWRVDTMVLPLLLGHLGALTGHARVSRRARSAP